MAGKGKTFNIEIGDSLTKICQVILKGENVQIKNCFMFQTPENLVKDGVIVSPEELANKLKDELDARNMTDCKNVVFCLSSGKVAAREVKLPSIKENRLKGFVETNAAEYFPIDLSEYHVTYSLLERMEGDLPICRALILAAPLSLLEGYFQLAEFAGLSIRAIDFSGNSQYQALHTIGADKVAMYVNVGCDNLVVTFMSEGKLQLQRSFAFGGKDLVLAYMEAAGKKPDEYIDALADCVSLEKMKEGLLSEDTIRENLFRLVSSISRSLDYFNSNYWDIQLEEIVLMGSCGHIAGLKEMIERETGIPTDYLDRPPAIASSYIACIGSAIAPLDFMPDQFRTDKKSRKKRDPDTNAIREGGSICLLCLAVTLLFCLVGFVQYKVTLDSKAELEAEIENLAYVQDVFDRYTTYQASANALLLLQEDIDSPNDRLRVFIEELESKMPSQILLLSAICNKDSITMNITVPNFDDAAVVLVQLRTFDSISNIQSTTMMQESDEAGGNYVSFSLVCTYGKNPYINGTNPYLTEKTEIEEDVTL